MKAKWTIYCYTDKDFDDAQKYISEKKLNGKAIDWNQYDLHGTGTD